MVTVMVIVIWKLSESVHALRKQSSVQVSVGKFCESIDSRGKRKAIDPCMTGGSTTWEQLPDILTEEFQVPCRKSIHKISVQYHKERKHYGFFYHPPCFYP